MIRLDRNNLPAHIGIIMDGNGRWAKRQGKTRTAGHREGLNAAKRIVKALSDLEIPYVTLYTFSTENWKRAEEEVSFLMKLLTQHLGREWEFYKANHIRVVHSGDRDRLPPAVQAEIDGVLADTADFDGTTVNLAINYGGRDEIIRAVRRWLADSSAAADGGAEHTERSPFSAQDLQKHLDHPDFPDPDIIIRTAGEQRLSNFLVWESAYSELIFSEKLWPDWTDQDLFAAIREYQMRIRKFGGIK